MPLAGGCTWAAMIPHQRVQRYEQKDRLTMNTEASRINLAADLERLAREIRMLVPVVNKLQEANVDGDASRGLSSLPQALLSQVAAIEARLQAVASASSDSAPPLSSKETLTASLAGLYASLHHAAFAYAVLHARAHRAFDSAGEGNTADLAETHMRECLAAAGNVIRLVSHAAVAELERDGHECRCVCPSCGLGICLCARHGEETVVRRLEETAGSTAIPGIEVRMPRAGSPASAAGLREGDRIMAAEGRDIASNADLQTTVRSAAPDAPIRLQVARPPDNVFEVIISRS
ncbi:hypothetical protein DCC78_08325 [bacterium]|nr:MAG: hypothetical protein DCC78_08325 [bacterium]